MKGARFLYLILILAVNWVAFMRQTSYAASSQQTSTQNSVGQNSDRSLDTDDAAHLSPAENGPAGNAPAKHGSADHVSHENERNPSAEPQAHRPISAGNHSRSRARLTASNRLKQLSNAQKHSSGKAPNLHSTRSDKSSGAARNGSVQNQAGNHMPQVRSTSVVQSTGASLNPLPNYARHRGPNPAVVAGTRNTNSTGGLNGTSMHRKP